MADISKLRTSLNGFNRSDVVNYIESMSVEHQKQLRQLKDEIQKLTAEKDSAAAELACARQTTSDTLSSLDDVKLELSLLQEQDASLQEQVVSLSQQAAELEEARRAAVLEAEAARQELASLQSGPENAEDTLPETDEIETEPEEPLSITEKELEAYRRAEAVERNAISRANRLYEQLTDLCDTSRTRCADSSEEIAALTSDLAAGLARLQEAFADAQLIFDEAQNAFDELEIAPES